MDDSPAILLKQAVATMEGLVHAMEEEYEALIHGQLPRLRQAIADKQRLAEEMEGLSRRLSPWEPLAEREPLLWKALGELALRGRELNRRNGTVVLLGQHHVQRALALLGGEGLYGPGAYPVPSPRSRPIAKV